MSRQNDLKLVNDRNPGVIEGYCSKKTAPMIIIANLGRIA